MRGPGTSPSSIARFSAKPALPGEPRSRTVVKPARRVTSALRAPTRVGIFVGVDRLAPEGAAGRAGQVDVRVDQAGKDGAGGQVDQPRALRVPG